MRSTLKPIRQMLAIALSILVIALMASRPVQAQFGTGTVNGTVSDATGAAIPNSSLTLTDVETNQTRKVVADQRGHYSVPDLKIGRYRLEASAPGFGTATKEGIEVTVGAQLTVDLPLTAGQVSTNVTVNSNVESEVNSTSGEQSTLIDQKQIRDLPLNGRNFEQLILLAPGVQTAQAASRSSIYGRSASYSISGARPEGQLLLLDGANISGFWNRGTGASLLGTSLGIDAIAEFQTLTGIYGAQFGGNGSVINAVTRSGTNQIHGTVYDFVRNSVFDSRNYFDLPNGPPSFRRNQFGGSIGLPIRKDKTFFFLNYEGIRQQLGEALVYNVPDSNAHAGLLPCIINTTTCLSGLTNVGVNANVAPFLALLPLPNGPLIAGTGTGQYTSVANNPVNENYFHGRLDEVLSPKDNLALRYVSDNGYLIDPFPGQTLAGFPEVSIQRNRFATIEEKHVFSSKFLNTARLHFTRTGQGARQVGKNPLYAPFQFLPNVRYGSYLISSLQASGSPNSGIGSLISSPSRFIQNKYALQDDVFLTIGQHQLQFGGDVTSVVTNGANYFYGSGQYTFPTLATFLTATPSLAIVALPGSDAERNSREIDVSPYIQDDWKVNSHLSLNVGIRYDFVTNPIEANNKFENILNIATDKTFTPVQHVYGSNPSLKNIDPRFGFSYAPLGTRTAIRGGFGIFHNPIAARTYLTSQILSLPYQLRAIVNPTFPNPLVGGVVGAPTLSNGQLYNTSVSPYQMQFSLGIQQKLDSATVLTVSYVGNLGRHLFYPTEVNPPNSQICPCTDAVNPQAATLPAGTRYFPVPVRGYVRGNTAFGSLTFDPAEGTSNYNSLQSSLVRSLSHGVQFQVNYTYSKALDISSLSNPAEAVNGATAVQDPFNVAADYGPAAYDVRHVGTANVLYVFPTRGENRLLNGWEATLLAQIHSGSPYNIIDGFDRTNVNSGLVVERPNLVGNPNVAGPVAANPGCVAPTAVHTVSHWFNPCAVVLQALGTFGNEGRDQFYSPGFKDFDFAAIKNTKLREGMNLELRAELFNIFNHTNLGYPNFVALTGVPASAANIATVPFTLAYNQAAGQITSTTNTARQIQFGLKLRF